MKYLLDTNVISEPTKTIPDHVVMEQLKHHQHEVATAAPVWHELLYGCFRLPPSKKRDMLKSFIKDVIYYNMKILPYDDRAAEYHAAERARLASKGRTPSFTDGQIAAIAKVNELILVTRNMSDFEGFYELKIENWHGGNMLV